MFPILLLLSFPADLHSYRPIQSHNLSSTRRFSKSIQQKVSFSVRHKQNRPSFRTSFSFLSRRDADNDNDMTTSSTPQNLKVFTTLLQSIGASTSILVSFTFFFFLATRRDALMVSFFLGAITNGILSKALKRVLNQERPVSNDDTIAIEKPDDKGMPSSHAMSLGFLGMFTMLTLEWTRLIIPLYVAISLYYRIQTRLHTVEQVAVGLIIGTTNGFVWRHLVDGTNPWGINVMDWCSNTLLNEQGLLPVTLLIVPAVAGLVVVGSLERKISKWIKSQ
jgi:membrane-associated phospholipid phosphatase